MQTKEELLKKLFHDQLTHEEYMILMDLLKTDSSHQGPAFMLELFHQLEDPPPSKEPDFDRIKERILEKVAVRGIPLPEPANELNPLKKSNRILSFLKVSYAAAAAVIILAIAAVSMYQTQRYATQTIQTDFDEIVEVVLPDSSHVSLNGNSSLTYNKNWKKGEIRTVYLTGEAFFQVTKSTISPRFQVITKGLNVEVLGTSFNVNQRAAHTAVYLEEGRVNVKLEKSKEKIVLAPGELLTYSPEQEKIGQPITVTSRSQTSWKEGMLMFKEKPLLHILNKLAEAHKLQYHVLDSALLQAQLTISIPTEDMNEAMSVLEKTTDISISKEGNTYVLKPRDIKP